MGPSPVEQNYPERREIDDSGDREDDGDWHIGYEVEMHGVGIEEHINNSDDTSDAETDSCDEEDRHRYSGYQELPTSDGPFEADGTDCGNVNPVLYKDFEEALDSASSIHLKDIDFKITDKPKPIELTEDKIESIKKTMSSFTLPAPLWASNIESDNELKKLLEKLGIKGGVPQS